MKKSFYKFFKELISYHQDEKKFMGGIKRDAKCEYSSYSFAR